MQKLQTERIELAKKNRPNEVTSSLQDTLMSKLKFTGDKIGMSIGKDFTLEKTMNFISVQQ